METGSSVGYHKGESLTFGCLSFPREGGVFKALKMCVCWLQKRYWWEMGWTNKGGLWIQRKQVTFVGLFSKRIFPKLFSSYGINWKSIQKIRDFSKKCRNRGIFIVKWHCTCNFFFRSLLASVASTVVIFLSSSLNIITVSLQVACPSSHIGCTGWSCCCWMLWPKNRENTRSICQISPTGYLLTKGLNNYIFLSCMPNLGQVFIGHRMVHN